jgi:hypothetical protein
VAHPQIAVFARLANGNAQTVRRIEGQATLLARTQHSIYYNHIRDEIVVNNPWAQSVLTFRADADGETPPLRILQGPLTKFGLADVMTGDPINKEYYVPAGDGAEDAIYVFDDTAVGNVAAKRVIRGVNGLPSVAYEHNLLLMGAEGGGLGVYERTVSGDAKPLRVITGGPRSGVNPPNSAVWIPGTRNFIAAVRPFGIRTYGDRPGAPVNYQTVEEAMTYVGVWSMDDSGDVGPRYTIAHDILKEFRNFAINPKNKEVMMSDKTANAIYTFSWPEAWETFKPESAPPYIPPARGRGRGAAPNMEREGTDEPAAGSRGRGTP